MSMSLLDNLNFVDVHYHANPDLYQRRHGVLAIGEIYRQYRGAIVLKSHLGATAVQATIAQQQGLPVFPSLVLNDIAGGICFKPIIRALSEYQPLIPSKLIVHLPTITGRSHKSKLSRTVVHPRHGDALQRPETIFDDQGRLKKSVVDIVKCAADYPIVLSTGHASKQELIALTEACAAYNVPSLLYNQPANPMTGLTASELLQITAQYNFVWVEQTALTFLLGYQTRSDFLEVVTQVPKVIYSSDLGQTTQMDIPSWLQRTDDWFAQFKLSTQRREEICLTNPLQMIMQN